MYILKVKWRKKNNWGHNFQTKKKRIWNIMKLYKQREKSIKFNIAHLPAHFWTYKVHSSGMHQVYRICYKSFKSSEIWSILRSPGKYQLASLIVGFVFFQSWILTSILGILSPCWSRQYIGEEVDTKHNVLHINFYLPLLHSWFRESEGVQIAFALHAG